MDNKASCGSASARHQPAQPAIPPERFGRTALLLGAAGVDRLRRARVLLFGLGGVGSYTAEALARAGIGQITLVDADKVSLSNINRQLIALSSTVGMDKTAVMKARILDINPKAEVTAYPLFYGPETAQRFDFAAYDYIIDAIDTVSAKIDIAERAYHAGVPLISCMGAGNKLDPTKLEVADIYQTAVCPLARVMRRELKKRKIPALKVVYSREKALTPQALPGASAQEDGAIRAKRQTPGSVSFVPSAAGLILAAEAVCDLSGAKPGQTGA